MIRLLTRGLRRLLQVLTTDERAARRWLSAASHGVGAFLLASALTVLPFADAANPSSDQGQPGTSRLEGDVGQAFGA